MKHYCTVCETCEGRGEIGWVSKTNHPGGTELLEETDDCRDCDGTGLEFVQEFPLEDSGARVDVYTDKGLRGTYFFSPDDTYLAEEWAENEIYFHGVREVLVYYFTQNVALFEKAVRKTIYNV